MRIISGNFKGKKISLPDDEFTSFISTLDKLDNHFGNYAKEIKEGELQI